MQSILIVSDDVDFSNALVSHLSIKGHSARWRPSFQQAPAPAQNDPPSLDVIIMDATCADNTSWELCREFKRETGFPYVVALSPTAGIRDRKSAYENGADKVVEKSADLAEIDVELQYLRTEREERRFLHQQVVLARSAAFSAMATSSRIGQVVRFMQAAANATTANAIASAVLEMLENIGLYGLLRINLGDEPEYFTDTAKICAAELASLNDMRPQERLAEQGNILIVRDIHCGLLIRNFPTDSAELCGQLRDDLCVLIEAVESRCKSLLLERQADKQRRLLQVSLRVLERIIAETDAFNLDFTQQAELILDVLLAKMNEAFSGLDLNEEQETQLTALLNSSHQEMGSLFDQKRGRDEVLREIMNKLLVTISHSSA